MKRDHENIDQDPVWDLLRQAPRKEASPRFVDDVVRAARLSERDTPWWKRMGLPLAVGGLTTAATAAIVALLVFNQPAATPGGTGVVSNPPV